MLNEERIKEIEDSIFDADLQKVTKFIICNPNVIKELLREIKRLHEENRISDLEKRGLLLENAALKLQIEQSRGE